MGKVYHVNFREKKLEGTVADNQKEGLDWNLRKLFLDFQSSNDEKIQKLLDANRRSLQDEQNIFEVKELLQGNTSEQLFAILKDNINAWDEKPLFYLAVYQLLSEKINT